MKVFATKKNVSYNLASGMVVCTASVVFLPLLIQFRGSFRDSLWCFVLSAISDPIKLTMLTIMMTNKNNNQENELWTNILTLYSACLSTLWDIFETHAIKSFRKQFNQDFNTKYDRFVSISFLKVY